MRGNGRLKIEYTVWCGCPFCDCMAWKYLAAKTKRDAGREAKQAYGWTFTRAFGWVCKRCDSECEPGTESATNSEPVARHHPGDGCFTIHAPRRVKPLPTAAAHPLDKMRTG